MRFPPSFLDDIRDRLPISEVIGPSVTWDRKKTNTSRGDYWACCPFHGEKTPSFHCENRKGRYHCFGCGASGDHFRFLVEHDGLNFPEAVERLADQAGLPMPVMDRREREREEQRASLFDVMEMAAQFFRDRLQQSEGAKARAYLRERGIDPRTQEEFAIGYAPDDRSALKSFLASKGVSKEQIEACGLVVSGPDIAVSYDRFRDRVMFPIPNSRDRVIAFGGRALRPDVPAKYLNSPETDLFHKSNVLYNYSRARKNVRDSGTVIVAEGYMDVIALHQAGFPNAVAPLGTALTEFQLELLWRMCEEPVLCFDGDGAGLKAAYRSADLALSGLRPGRSVRFALLPEDKDPDDLIREEGPSAMQAVFDEAAPLVDLLWSRETETNVFDTPEKRAKLEARLREIVGMIRDESVRRHYLQEVQERLSAFFGDAGRRASRPGSSDRGSRNRFSSGMRSRQATPGRIAASSSLLNSAVVKKGSARLPLRETVLVAGAMFHPAILKRLFDEFAALPVTHSALRDVHGAILDAAASEDDETPEEENLQFVRFVCGQCGDEIVERMSAQLRENRLWQVLPDASFEDALDGWRQAYRLHVRRHTLESELRLAEGAFAREESEANFEQLVQIRNELAREEGMEAMIEGFGVSSGRPARNY